MNIIVAIIVRLNRAPESRMHQNAPFRRRTCQILFCGGGTAHCPGPTPTGEGPSPDPTLSVPLHLIAFSTWPPDHISGYGLATRGQILQQKCNKFDFGCGSAPTLLEELTQGRHLRGATALLPPHSKAKQKIICSAKLPHTRRHILARRLPFHCMSVQFVCTSILPPSYPNLMLHF